MLTYFSLAVQAPSFSSLCESHPWQGASQILSPLSYTSLCLPRPTFGTSAFLHHSWPSIEKSIPWRTGWTELAHLADDNSPVCRFVKKIIIWETVRERERERWRERERERERKITTLLTFAAQRKHMVSFVPWSLVSPWSGSQECWGDGWGLQTERERGYEAVCVRAESRGAGSGTVGCGCSSLAAESAPQWCHRDGLCGPFLHANSTQIFKTTLPLPLSLLPPSFPPSSLSLSFS